MIVALFWDVPVTWWVQSDGFRGMISRETSKGLKVKGEFKPVHKDAWVVTTDGFTSTGLPGEVVAKLDATRTRAVFNPAGYWDDMWEFSRIDIDSAVLGLRAPNPAERAPVMPKPPKPWWARYLPSRVVPKEIISHRTRVEWMFMKEQAHIDGIEVRVTPVGVDWLFSGSGGTMHMAMLPPLRVEQLDVMMSKPYLEVKRFNLRGVEEGDPARVKLFVKMGTQPADKSLRATLAITEVPVRNALPDALKDAILARASGDVAWESQPGGVEMTRSTGRLSLSNLRVQGLPFLRQLSLFQDDELDRAAADVALDPLTGTGPGGVTVPVAPIAPPTAATAAPGTPAARVPLHHPAAGVLLSPGATNRVATGGGPMPRLPSTPTSAIPPMPSIPSGSSQPGAAGLSPTPVIQAGTGPGGALSAPLLPGVPGSPAAAVPSLLPGGNPTGQIGTAPAQTTPDMGPPPGISFTVASMSYEWKDGLLVIPDLELKAPGLVDFTGNLRWHPNLEKKHATPPAATPAPSAPADATSPLAGPPAKTKRPVGHLEGRAELRNVSLEAFFPGLRGIASGTATWEGDPTDTSSTATARLTLTGAALEKMPFLHQMAKLTGHPELSTIAFNDTSWNITYRNGTFECNDLRLISPGNFDIAAKARSSMADPESGATAESKLDVAIRDLALKRWLPANLQQSVDGKAQSTMLWTGPTNDFKAWEATGLLKIAGARLSNIHILSQLARMSGHADMASLNFQTADVTYGFGKQGLRIDKLNFRSAGNLWLSGSMSFPEKDNLRANLELRDLPLQRWLPKSLQPMLDGVASGTLQFTGHPRHLKGARATGRLSLRNGRLHQWRVLDMAARLLGDPTLRTLDFREASVDYQWIEGSFYLSNLSVNAPGKLWIRGNVRMDEKTALHGKIRIGLAPRYLTWMPRARADLFSEQRGGYAWATFDVGGTIKKPEQDLSQRLVRDITSDTSAMLFLAGKAISWYVGDLFGFPYGRLIK
ncbi:hypothetical protein DB346_19370 [Verrucomicrobia bacterium LW23]|nr:hypothetical protein DB346_19370 [Verrucomicrobia bacterium LW23]